MKEYKLVYLNKGLSMTHKKDFEKAEDEINRYVSEGWTLQQIVSPNDLCGVLVGVFWKEKN